MRTPDFTYVVRRRKDRAYFAFITDEGVPCWLAEADLRMAKEFRTEGEAHAAMRRLGMLPSEYNLLPRMWSRHG